MNSDGDAISYSIAGADADFLSIDTDDGEIRLKALRMKQILL